MHIGIVRGMVVSTQKDANLVGHKLLIVQRTDSKGKAVGQEEVAVDVFDAGVGDQVLLCQGSPARAILGNAAVPVDLAVAGIIDRLDQPGGDAS